MRQTLAVTALNIKSIPQRLGMSLATVMSVALVVAVMLGFMALTNGFAATLNNAGSEDVAIILRAGSQAELNSGLSRDDVVLIETAPGIVRDAEDRPVSSAELYVVVDGIKRSSQTEANLPLRGVEEGAERLRQGFTLVEGRMFAPGAAELIVGEGVGREFQGFDVGSTIRLGSNVWTIVGKFSTGGTVFDSELWTEAGVLQNLYQRGASYQSVRVKLDGPEGLSQLQDYAENEPRLSLDIITEKQYFADQAVGMTRLISAGVALAYIMAIGALAGAWNTMYSSVDARVHEIATLRAIGFSGGSAFIGTMLESLMLAAIGGLVGAIAVYVIFDGMSASTLGGGFTQVVFSLSLTPSSIISGMILAIFVGLFGGLVPSIRAATVPLLQVHR
ncbi:ABC transporter permease [Woodsholea maritima]|uniref:ABC transporter permease n=1 Tax=Woodsholea maritima TaxID=240237 RepID=UPI0003622B56|nr:ABC transporter permease [Woodsholea maritima]